MGGAIPKEVSLDGLRNRAERKPMGEPVSIKPAWVLLWFLLEFLP